MNRRTLCLLAGLMLAAALLAGCGAARQLTTRTRTFSYRVDFPPAPVVTTMHEQTALDEEVRNTYRKYHGGVDWTRLGYHVANISPSQPGMLKIYVSLNDAVPTDQLEQQATLIETIELAPGEERTVTLEQAAPNEAMRAFLADALAQREVTTLHYYAHPASPDPTAAVTVENLAVQVQVHGSYF